MLRRRNLIGLLVMILIIASIFGNFNKPARNRRSNPTPQESDTSGVMKPGDRLLPTDSFIDEITLQRKFVIWSQYDILYLDRMPADPFGLATVGPEPPEAKGMLIAIPVEIAEEMHAAFAQGR